MTLKRIAFCFTLLALAVLFLVAPAAVFGQSVGYDTPTLKPFLIAVDGRLVYDKTVNGKVVKPSPAYHAWPYSGNPLASQALDPDDHERVINIVRKAVYNEKPVEIGWITAAGFAGGFQVLIDGRPVINALQVAMWHMQFGESVAIDKLRYQFASTGLLTSEVPQRNRSGPLAQLREWTSANMIN